MGKRARRKSSESVAAQSDVSFSDAEEYRPHSGSAEGRGGNRAADHKAELRRLKNREAARRVRERKSHQLNAFKSQVLLGGAMVAQLGKWFVVTS
jgi:hypothetical protein